MTVDNAEDLAGIRRAGAVVATVLRDMLAAMKPGMTTRELDQLGERRLLELGGVSAPQAMYDFPGATCISVNQGAAHGIPGDYVIAHGDMVNVDVSAKVGDYWADNGGSAVAGVATPEQERLLAATIEARDLAIAAIRPGVPFRVVGRIFEEVAERHGFSIIRNLCSHGVGRSLHEDPRELYPYYRRGERRRFSLGQVIALEPFLTTGRGWVDEADDGWTLNGSIGSLSAQFEHTIIVTRHGTEVVTIPLDS